MHTHQTQTTHHTVPENCAECYDERSYEEWREDEDRLGKRPYALGMALLFGGIGWLCVALGIVNAIRLVTR